MRPPLITIFNGRQRGLGEGDKPRVYAQLSVEFANYLFYFKGASLAVFQCIALKANAEGWAWPSIPFICKKTGYQRDAVQKAVAQLCRLEIPDYGRVLLRSQPRISGKFIDAHYLIFPNQKEIERFESDRDFPPRLAKLRKNKNSPEHGFPAPVKSGTVKSGTVNHAVMHELETILTRTMQSPEIHTQPEAALARAGVSVNQGRLLKKDLSIHLLDDLLAYHEAQRARGSRIDPLACALARLADGKLDGVVTDWKKKCGQAEVINCPTCKGSGFDLARYGGIDGELVRCDHRALAEADDDSTSENVA
jgi:hypothetical protein